MPSLRRSNSSHPRRSASGDTTALWYEPAAQENISPSHGGQGRRADGGTDTDTDRDSDSDTGTRPDPGTRLGAGLAAYSAARVPRTTAIVRQATRTGRMTAVTSPAVAALRDAAIVAASRFGPGLLLRSFAGIADWRPPRRTYASGTPHQA
ncbi:hypothetical protein ACFYYH_16290 [Streptomyces sp. NPDC002018]|uniref:hypothetical protein n=1 Tax=Streptomyces sp. NPDC002018 TaxID=3364629 RepID=UPI0036A916E3